MLQKGTRQFVYSTTYTLHCEHMLGKDEGSETSEGLETNELLWILISSSVISNSVPIMVMVDIS